MFLADAVAVGARKKALCAAFGLVGLYPLDGAVPLDGIGIYRANLAMMRSADAVVANLTPFRGPSADAGTVLELGLMAGMGRAVFGYSDVASGYTERAVAACAGRLDAVRGWVDGEGMAIEAFGLGDNLMIDGVLEGRFVRGPGSFERCLALAAEALKAPRRG